MMGPGKYDDVATAARQASQARDGVILLVFNGRHGHGFSVQLSVEALAKTLEILRQVAAQIDQDLAQLKNQPQETSPAAVLKLATPCSRRMGNTEPKGTQLTWQD